MPHEPTPRTANHAHPPRGVMTRLRAFTLIELIVVLLVVGVLASIALVAYSSVTTRAQVTAAAANLVQVDTAVLASATSSGASSLTRTGFLDTLSATGATVQSGVYAGGVVYVGGPDQTPTRAGDYALAFDDGNGNVSPDSGVRAVVLLKAGDGNTYKQIITLAAGAQLSPVTAVSDPSQTAGQTLSAGSPVTLPAAPASVGYQVTSFTAASPSLMPTVAGLTGTVTYSESGSLPAGVTFDPATGTLTGPAGLASHAITLGRGSSQSSAVITSAGALYTWGWNAYGQLGDGTSTNRLTPVEVGGALAGKTVTSVAVGENNMAAITSDGAVYTWGAGGTGQLGTGVTGTAHAPVLVGGLLAGKTVKAVSVGYSHMLALTSDGTLYSWGDNANGELGDGSTTRQATPVKVVGFPAGTTFTAISAGDMDTLALASDGSVYACGSDNQGQLGIGAIATTVTALTKVGGALAGKTVEEVSAGWTHTVARTSDGSVYTWGSDGAGELGNGKTSTTGTGSPVQVGGLLAGQVVTAVAAGNAQTLVAVSGGTVFGWGQNSHGQVGDGTTSPRTLPVQVGGASRGLDVTDLAAGTVNSSAIAADGSVLTWGYNGDGELGNGTTTQQVSPVSVPTFPQLTGFPFDVTVTATTATQSATTGLVTFTAQ